MAGTLTRLQMSTEVLDNLSRSSSGITRNQATLATRVVTWLDRASLKVARQEDLLFSIATATTIADQKDYAMPDNIRALFSIRVENGLNSRKLECAMPRDFDLKAPKPNEITSFVPSIYVPYKTTNTFELFPIPDQAYILRLRYSFWPGRLATDASLSDYSYMDDVLIYYATSEGFKWLQELKDADFWQKRGDEALAAAIRAERDAFPDWEPVLEGFSLTSRGVMGEYWNNPFIIGVES